MATKRKTLTDAATLAIKNSSMGLSDCITTYRRELPEALDHSTFPLGHVVDSTEQDQRMPGMEWMIRVPLEIRVYLHDPTYTTLDTMIQKFKELYQAGGLRIDGMIDSKFTQMVVITQPAHRFVVLSIDFEYTYHHLTGTV